VRIDDVPVPSSPVTRLAEEVAGEHHTPALLNHVWRSYLWSASLGVQRGLAFDPELLFVAAMLHDIGLVPAFDAHEVPFEEAGGQVAAVFAAGAGWPAPRRVRVAEIVVRHMWPSVDPDDDPEGHLLEVGTGLDISGRGADLWPAALRTEVLDRYPRLDLAAEFTRLLQLQAARKPGSSAERLVQGGLADRLARNPLG
jgi:hypothetical protein